MHSTVLRRYAWLTLFSFVLGLAAPTLTLAAAPAPAKQRLDITGKITGQVHKAVDKVIAATLKRANKSPRIQLKKNFSYRDGGNRLLFDISGVVKVRIKNAERRARFAEEGESNKTKVLSTNGPIAVDLAISPVAIEGEDVVFAIHADLTIKVAAILQELVRTSAQVVGVVAINAAAAKLLDALANFSSETAGKALELGVENLPAVLGGEAGAIAYASFQTKGHKSWKDKLKATATPAGILKHFALAAIFSGVTSGMKAVGATVGAAVGTALLPGAGSFVATLAATSALVWFGNYVVRTVGVKLPVLWRLAKIGRLYRKAVEAEGARREKLSAKFGEYTDKILKKVQAEIQGGYKRWVFLELMIRYFRKRVYDAGTLGNNLADFDVVPYQPLIDGVSKTLLYEMTADKDWYAGRMYYQFLASVRQLPEGMDHPPLPGQLVEELELLEDQATVAP